MLDAFARKPTLAFEALLAVLAWHVERCSRKE
jgi:hypothetical protein